MLENACAVNKFLQGYCDMMVSDVPEERICEQPAAAVNHPAWILGHLSLSADFGLRALGAPTLLDESWSQMFGIGSQPVSESANYPTKAELLATFHAGYAAFREAASNASSELLQQPNPSPRLKEHLPTLELAAAFLLSGHFGVHAGQLSMWRRLAGFAPMF